MFEGLERDASGNTVTRLYSANDLLLAETAYRVADPDGAGPAQPSAPLSTRYVYDSAGRLRFTTFYGPYAIDPKTGRQTAHPMLVTQWQRGRKEIVWPREVAEVQPLYPGPLWE